MPKNISYLLVNLIPSVQQCDVRIETGMISKIIFFYIKLTHDWPLSFPMKSTDEAKDVSH